MLRRKFILLLVVMLIVLAGCKANDSNSATNKEEENNSETNGGNDEQEASDKETIYPLTGTSGETSIDKRPFVVIINNDINARPQSGLHKADIVYEVLAEGDITRLLAVFQSEIPTDLIGPVRSARSYFVDLAKGYDPVFVFHGWSPEAREKIQAHEVDGLNGLSYDGSLFKRASFRKAPHNSYITYDNIEKGAAQLAYFLEANVPPLSFANEGDSVEGAATEYVKIPYSTRVVTHVEYKYDEAKNHYVRYSGEVKSVDLDTSEEIVAHNIFIVETSHTVVDNAGRREIDITSGGRGILIRDGIRQEVDWKEVDGRILPYLNNQPVPLTPGKTWIQLISDLDIVTY
ncbi:DUF3048 domain-containing protein [Sutcliffiella halmapala]|uniref:DUF3048 domain-containing protein n=1 Tax=Sutcliffiella halmapala TaxID=79882 RepID=UPI001F2D6D69|nr:DUF3048 domain-containing protein [Sutcliffiella halmapala]